MPLIIECDAFANNAAIPKKYTGDGEDVSPALRWSGVPAGTAELALICDDPDAPTPQPWVHWLIYKLSPQFAGLPENVAKMANPQPPADAVQGKNSFGKLGYGGPAPPRGHGLHHYHFRLYALNQTWSRFQRSLRWRSSGSVASASSRFTDSRISPSRGSRCSQRASR